MREISLTQCDGELMRSAVIFSDVHPCEGHNIARLSPNSTRTATVDHTVGEHSQSIAMSPSCSHLRRLLHDVSGRRCVICTRKRGVTVIRKSVPS